MQSFDDQGNIRASQMLGDLGLIEKELNDPNVAHVTIGKLPKKGDEVVINGLRYKAITGRNRIKKDKRLTLELL